MIFRAPDAERSTMTAARRGIRMPHCLINHSWLRRSLIAAVLIIVPSPSAYIGYQTQPVNSAEQESVEPVVSAQPILAHRPVTLAPGIHLLGGLAPAAAYVVESSAGLILIDSGLEPDARRLKDEMSSLRLDWKSIHAILLTHAHADHCGGAEYLRRATGARVYAGAEDAAVLRAGGPREAFLSVFDVPDGVRPAATPVDIELHGDETLEFGDMRIHTLATPGHTPGSVCYLLETGRRRVLFSGDVIMSLEVVGEAFSPLERPLGTYAAYLAPRYRGDAHAFANTLRSLRTRPAPDLVLPGHPRNNLVPADASMCQERWERILDSGIREMDHLLYRYATEGASFLDGEPKKLLPELYYFGDFQHKAVYAFVADSQLFVVTAPGGVGLHGFLASRMSQLDLDPRLPTSVLLTSISPDKSAELQDLFQTFRGKVAVPVAAHKTLERICNSGTEPMAAERIAERLGATVFVLPMESESSFSVAYQVRIHDKSILFTGLVPFKPIHGAGRRLAAAVLQVRAHRFRVRALVDQLRECKPHLWLPAVVADGQNANLDQGEWRYILNWNDGLLQE
jgi:glyoxylase-like metal-dependent hydrolase (beta-lactamase superfamily II)